MCKNNNKRDERRLGRKLFQINNFSLISESLNRITKKCLLCFRIFKLLIKI